jgi:DUF4097 and DUF4098 domain-containing protein YvlB
MIRKSIHVAFVFLCLSFITALVQAQDFQRTFRLTENSKVSIKNVAGDVSVNGYEGTDIRVVAYKEGRDRDRLTIEDFSNGGGVDIRVKYPQDCNCEATIRFEVQVPRALSFNYESLSTVAGNVKVDQAMGMIRAENISGLVHLRNVSGTLYASSFSGDVFIERAAETPTRGNGRWRRGFQRYLPFSNSTGSVIAKSISGNVKVELVRLEGATLNRMEFSSTSGNVQVKMPEGLGAMVEMATAIGQVTTDFPLTVIKNVTGIGASARGKVGDGARELIISSVSGNLSLLKN